jgi:membrane-anchored protein YejM (alkaline phosphatase superfamily)
VQAADAALGAMEDRLAAQGRWDTDTVIVTSDHWVRRQTGQDPTFSPDENLLERLQERAHRVPFMVKMPGQRSGALVSTPFATVLLRQLVNQLLKGGVRDDQGLVRWMKRNASPGEGEATLHVPF